MDEDKLKTSEDFHLNGGDLILNFERPKICRLSKIFSTLPSNYSIIASNQIQYSDLLSPVVFNRNLENLKVLCFAAGYEYSTYLFTNLHLDNETDCHSKSIVSSKIWFSCLILANNDKIVVKTITFIFRVTKKCHLNLIVMI